MAEGEKLNWYDFGNLTTADELTSYMNREYEHGAYMHYTSLNAIDKILKNKEFRLSSVGKFNDKDEFEETEAKQKYFSLCFSTGINENFSLWYLYSGIDGKGGCISFTKAKVKKLITASTYKLVEVDATNNVAKEICCLIPNKDIDISFKDVLYIRKDKKGKVSLKYNTMTNYRISKEELEKYQKQRIGFVKNIFWYHEKETRLLIYLKDHIYEKLEADKTYKVILNFSHLKDKDMKIKLAPEIESIVDGIKDKENIKQFLYNTSNISLSDYAGTVSMKLCDNCKFKNKTRQGEII